MSGMPKKPGRKKKLDYQKRWTRPGAEGFKNWYSDISPMILGASNKYEIFKPTEKQKENIEKILKTDKDGNYKHSLSLLIQPRRHGKSTVYRLIVLWLLTSRKNFNIALLGNSDIHSRKTQFLPLVRTIKNTPKLLKLIPENSIVADTVSFKPYDSQVSVIKDSAVFGEKINILWVSDLHASLDTSRFGDLQASLMDSENSLILIDSNCDENGGQAHSLQEESKTDSSIYCDHLFYKNFQEYERKAPAWINRKKAKRLKKTLLPAQYRRDVLGQRSDSINALFPQEIINQCLDFYKTPVQSIEDLAKGRKYKIGAGLDRAKNLFGGDNTIWTVVLKLASPLHGEPEYFILEQKSFPINTGRLIKKSILQSHEKYNLDACILENFETGDLSFWMHDQGIPVELLSPHDRNQSLSFTEFYRIAKEKRLHIPKHLTELQSEMQTFGYTRKNSRISFGHVSQKFKDDRVYSLNWAIFSLRQSVLHSYEVNNITCRNKSQKRKMCYLFDGDLILLCSQQCQTHNFVQGMFQQYKAIDFDSDLTLPEFFQTKCKFSGARIQQAV